MGCSPSAPKAGFDRAYDAKNASAVPEAVAFFFNGEKMSPKVDRFFNGYLADSHVLEFIGPYAPPVPPLDKEHLQGAMGNLMASFPDLTFNFTSVAPKKRADGGWAADIVVMGTHTGPAFSPKPGVLPAVETTGTCVKIGPETFTLYLDAAGKITKTTIEPLHEGAPAGPPGFYTEIGGVMPKPPAAAAAPTFFTVVHEFIDEEKANAFWAMIGGMGEADWAAMRAKHAALGFYNHSFMPSSMTGKVNCLWECKHDTSAADFQAFIDGADGPAPGIMRNTPYKLMPGAITPASYFEAESAPAPPKPSTGSFFWVYHTFKSAEAAGTFWSMMGSMTPDDLAAMGAKHNELGFHNHSFAPCGMEGPCICIWESRAPMDAAAFQAFIDGPDGPGAGGVFDNEVFAAMAGAMLPSAKWPKPSLQARNIARVQELVGEFMAGNPAGYLAGVADDMRGSVLAGLIPGGDGFTTKEQFAGLMGEMDKYMEVKKFQPSNWRATGDDVLFQVDWEFVWKATGKTVETTALVRKVLRDGLICEKYHMVDVEAVTGEAQPASANVTRVQALLAEFQAGRPEGYMAGVADDVKADMLGGIIPGADAIANKAQFGAVMGKIGDYLDVKKFAPHTFRALPNDDIMFLVDWSMVYKPTGKAVDVTSVVRKVVKDGMITEKYHMCDNDAVLAK